MRARSIPQIFVLATILLLVSFATTNAPSTQPEKPGEVQAQEPSVSQRVSNEVRRPEGRGDRSFDSGNVPSGERPNILFILTDDQEVESMSEMPQVQSRLTERGTTFSRAFVTTAMCCPARASILRGQYAHNHGIWINRAPEGGFERFKELGHENSTVATWLDDAGYHTGFIGKYLNEYGSYEEPTTHVPPGWDTWIGYQGGPQEQKSNGAFKINVQGKISRVESVHDTDYMAQKAESYIRNRKKGKPWFLTVSTNAPHVPALTSGRNDGTYEGRRMPRTPSFNESDVSDKASAWQDNPRLPKKCPSDYQKKADIQCVPELEELWRDRMESLQDVDDMVGRLTKTLREEDFMRETYIVFTSDNGLALYKNRIFSKGAPYESSQQVPFVVRGPGVPGGEVDDRLVANIDLAPTFAEWAGARTPTSVDGRSFADLLGNPYAPWRTRLLFEHRLGNHDYNAVRTEEDEVYIEYPVAADETEYYDLTEDPHQLDGDAEEPPPELKRQLRYLKHCSGAGCRAAD